MHLGSGAGPPPRVFLELIFLHQSPGLGHRILSSERFLEPDSVPRGGLARALGSGKSRDRRAPKGSTSPMESARPKGRRPRPGDPAQVCALPRSVRLRARALGGEFAPPRPS